MCMRRLIEEGADINALTNENKSPSQLAEEMKCGLVFARALQDSGRYDDDGTPRLQPRFTKDLAKRILFCSPFVCILNDPKLIVVYDLDCNCHVICTSVVSVVLDGFRMAYRSEHTSPNIRCKRPACWRTDPQNTIPSRHLQRHGSPRCSSLDIYYSSVYITRLGSVTDCSNLLNTSFFQHYLWTSFRDVNVLFFTICRFRSWLHSSTGRNIRTEEDCGGTGCVWRIRRATFLH